MDITTPFRNSLHLYRKAERSKGMADNFNNMARKVALVVRSGSTEILHDVGAIIRLVELLKVAQVLVQARPVAQLRDTACSCSPKSATLTLQFNHCS